MDIKEVISILKVTIEKLEILASKDNISVNYADKIKYKDIEIDVNQRRVTRENIEIYLTKSEYEILKLLLSNPGECFSRKYIYEHLHIGEKVYAYYLTSIDLTIHRIRNKIPNIIFTRRGYGFFVKANG